MAADLPDLTGIVALSIAIVILMRPIATLVRRAHQERKRTLMIRPHLGDVYGDPGGWRPETAQDWIDADEGRDGANVDFRRLVLTIIIVAALSLLGIAIYATHASAHDSWINRGGYKNAKGEACCGMNDCFVVPSTRIQIGADGYHVLGVLGPEIVPYSEAQRSPDGAYWRCKRPDGSRRCFFAPPPTN